MESKDLIRLKHMLDSTNAILAFLKGKKQVHLNSDRMLASAVIREFEVMGEAAGKVSPKIKRMFPELPWNQLVGMRNRLIHAYFDVSHDIIWKTARDHLPSLALHLEAIIAELETKD